MLDIAGGSEPLRDAVAPSDSAKRRQVLEGARRVFLSRGFDGASMGEIARAAGVSKGTLYTYFASKEALFEVLAWEERSQLAEQLFSLDAHDPDVRAVLRRLGHSFLSVMARPEHISLVRMVIGAADKFPRIGQVFFAAGPLQGASRLSGYLDEQVAQGRLVIDDTATAAMQLLDLLASGTLKRLLFAVGEAPPAAQIERNVEAALHVFFAAYGPQGP